MALAQIEAPEVTMVKRADYDLAAHMDAHRKIIEHGPLNPDIRLHGRLEFIAFVPKPKRGEEKKAIGRLDWNGQGPRVAFTATGEIVVLERIARELPDLPVTKGKFFERAADAPAIEDLEELKHLAELPAKDRTADQQRAIQTLRDVARPMQMRRQRWEDLGPCVLQGRDGDLMIFRNVVQIVFHATNGQWCDVRCGKGKFQDFSAVVIDPGTLEMFFVGGAYAPAFK